jgi:hypothetical protein
LTCTRNAQRDPRTRFSREAPLSHCLLRYQRADALMDGREELALASEIARNRPPARGQPRNRHRSRVALPFEQVLSTRDDLLIPHCLPAQCCVLPGQHSCDFDPVDQIGEAGGSCKNIDRRGVRGGVQLGEPLLDSSLCAVQVSPSDVQQRRILSEPLVDRRELDAGAVPFVDNRVQLDIDGSNLCLHLPRSFALRRQIGSRSNGRD